jgi:UDP-N-acetylmuramoylalanine--D-glutamate ligase
LLSDLRNQLVTVFGLGREGVDLARFLAAEGARVRVTDHQKPAALADALSCLAGLDIELSLGGHPLEEVLAADLIFVSPGIEPKAVPALVEADRRGLPLSSATELFFSRCPAPILGITGSSGKSTTTALVGEMLRGSGRQVVVGGNIGQPLLVRLPDIRPDSLVVMELSSFQLETIERSPAVATITNVTPNHLDRHGTIEAYVAAKSRILQFQEPGNWAVLNADDEVSGRFRPQGRLAFFSLDRPIHGAYLSADSLCLDLGGGREEVCTVAEIALRGRHNVANALAAIATSAVSGASAEAMRTSLRRFRGLPHRLQHLGQVDGVSFYDDSIATSPERSMAALASFDEPIILLAGGRDKHLPMDDWARMICQRVAGVVLFGEAGDLIRSALDQTGYPTERIKMSTSIQSAVQAALELAAPGHVVLLSPGCTSNDMFRDFVERGQVFAAAVRQLAGEAA